MGQSGYWVQVAATPSKKARWETERIEYLAAWRARAASLGQKACGRCSARDALVVGTERRPPNALSMVQKRGKTGDIFYLFVDSFPCQLNLL